MTLDKNHLLNVIKNTEPSGTPVDITRQFLEEIIAWKSLLYSFIQENNFLKTRLSEVVDKETDTLFIAHAEQFQNDFIQKDEYILDIGNDIKGQEKDLQLALAQNTELDLKVSKLQEKLRNEMSYLEKECSILKNKFNEYLLSVEE